MNCETPNRSKRRIFRVGERRALKSGLEMREGLS